MNRREFVGGGLLALAGTRNLKFAQANPITDKIRILYICESPPDFEIPPYHDERYEDVVPDTLDLTERLRLAVHASTSISDPVADDEVFWRVDLLRDPPAMAHDFQ